MEGRERVRQIRALQRWGSILALCSLIPLAGAVLAFSAATNALGNAPAFVGQAARYAGLVGGATWILGWLVLAGLSGVLHTIAKVKAFRHDFGVITARQRDIGAAAPPSAERRPPG